MAPRAHPQTAERPGGRRRPLRKQAPKVRIVVADSQAIDRGGIVGLLEGEPDFEVVGEAASLPEAIEECRALKPGLLLLSLNLGGQERLAAIPAIRAELPQLRILALSERGESNCLVLNPPSRQGRTAGPLPRCALGTDCLQLAVAQGAMGTLRRSADPEELFRAIRAVAAGHAWYDPTTAGAMLAATGPAHGAPLTEREREVAALIAEGRSNKEISTSLGISEPTVKKHVGQVLHKLGLADRLQAGLFLARHPLVLGR